MKTRHSHLAFE